MGLKSIKLPEAKVELPDGQSFPVRGLSLNDVVVLVRNHGDQLGKMFSEFSKQSDLTAESVAGFALPLLQAAPQLAAEIIAAGSGDSDSWPEAMLLPFPVQLDALEKVARLTFESGGGPKKLVETVIRLAQGTTGLLESLKA